MDMLTQLVNNLDLNSPFDLVVATCAVTGFWGQCRLGKLLLSSVSALSHTLLPTCADFKRSLRNSHSCILCLPHTKTHCYGQDVVLVDQHQPINLISLLKKHLQVNGVPGHFHIFSYLSSDSLISLTKSLFLQRCNAVWQHLGYLQVTGHCFCIGGTMELLVADTPPDIVKATRCWSSESFLQY
jgi:hypothetical protein